MAISEHQTYWLQGQIDALGMLAVSVTDEAERYDPLAAEMLKVIALACNLAHARLEEAAKEGKSDG